MTGAASPEEGETYTAVVELDDHANARTVILRDGDAMRMAEIDGSFDENVLARHGYRFVSGPSWRAVVEPVGSAGE
ncbi:MAG: hypothetical protein WAX14_19260 [Rhodococcus sp. (in: high G+C Gram-positive bacteria)]|uniref:hypothetical protein n=1 Tax=Rhodococcus sp. TaxID=1831 RepID=UPI003BB68F92